MSRDGGSVLTIELFIQNHQLIPRQFLASTRRHWAWPRYGQKGPEEAKCIMILCDNPDMQFIFEDTLQCSYSWKSRNAFSFSGSPLSSAWNELRDAVSHLNCYYTALYYDVCRPSRPPESVSNFVTSSPLGQQLIFVRIHGTVWKLTAAAGACDCYVRRFYGIIIMQA